jgi:hypothetical protein
MKESIAIFGYGSLVWRPGKSENTVGAVHQLHHAHECDLLLSPVSPQQCWVCVATLKPWYHPADGMCLQPNMIVHCCAVKTDATAHAVHNTDSLQLQQSMHH